MKNSEYPSAKLEKEEKNGIKQALFFWTSLELKLELAVTAGVVWQSLAEEK